MTVKLRLIYDNRIFWYLLYRYPDTMTVVNNKGETALLYVASIDHTYEDYFPELIKAGADISITNKDGDNIFTYIERSNELGEFIDKFDVQESIIKLQPHNITFFTKQLEEL